MATNIVMGYSPNDFFFMDAKDRKVMLSDQSCNAMKPEESSWDVSCNAVHFLDYSLNCVNRALCLNSKKVGYILTKEGSHKDSNEKYKTEQIKYEMTVMDIVNLGIGILFAIIIIYRNRNVK